MGSEVSKGTASAISGELELKIAAAILMGAKPVDVAEVNDLKYQACREALHRFCRNRDRELYESLASDAANDENKSSPGVENLQKHAKDFLGSDYEEPNRTREEIQEAMDSARRNVERARHSHRTNRMHLDQLQREMDALESLA